MALDASVGCESTTCLLLLTAYAGWACTAHMQVCGPSFAFWLERARSGLSLWLGVCSYSTHAGWACIYYLLFYLCRWIASLFVPNIYLLISVIFSLLTILLIANFAVLFISVLV
jgi:hypothetical protein